jgi:hypothetical protein
MTYEIMPSREHQGDWIASAVNDEGDGEMYLAFFSGPRSQQRAEEYAEWKNTGERRSEHRPAAITSATAPAS